MKLTAQVKLIVTPQQSAALLETLEQANSACDSLSEWAWQNQTFGQFAIHKGRYNVAREQSGLASQVIVRCIAKVADAYKLDKATQRTFNPHGAIAYDERILRWYEGRQQVSIWTTQGRLHVDYLCGEPQRELLKSQQGESDLLYRNGDWFLLATCNVDDPPQRVLDGVLGVDFGIVEIAVDSEGNSYSGEIVKKVRKNVREHRRQLQRKQTHSAKKRLRRVARKQSRFVRNTNHVVSKSIVTTALQSAKAIALEELKGIRERVSASKQMRWLLGNWAFDQLKQFITYKAKRAGIPVVSVDPRNTSRTCSCCGYCDKANRKSQARFECLQCGYQANADFNASRNLEARASLSERLLSSAMATA